MAQRWILQFCHCHYGPFLDVARQYAALFRDSPYKVLTVYLTGAPSPEVEAGSASDEVIFLNYSSRAVGGLKLSAIRALKKIAASRDFALVVAHRAKPIYIACLATGLPVIGVHHAFGDYQRMTRRWFANAFRRRLALFGVSDAVRDDIRRHLPSWPMTRIETLHNRLDVAAARAALLPRAEARAALGLPLDATVIANVGRLHPDKDQATLLAGFARALPHLPPDSQLVIIGSGPLRERLMDQARDLDIAERTRFLGQVPQAARLFPAFDLFVLSSDHEPFGMVLLEAMTAGVAVMTTACGGPLEIVRDPLMRFDVGDVDGLAGRLSHYFGGGRKESTVKTNHNRLEKYFSDEVARRRFFALPMVVSVLGAVSG